MPIPPRIDPFEGGLQFLGGQLEGLLLGGDLGLEGGEGGTHLFGEGPCGLLLRLKENVIEQVEFSRDLLQRFPADPFELLERLYEYGIGGWFPFSLSERFHGIPQPVEFLPEPVEISLERGDDPFVELFEEFLLIDATDHIPKSHLPVLP